MNLTIQKTFTLAGKVTLPSSKSQSIRGLLLALLCKGESVLSHFLQSQDIEDAIHICKQLGAEINLSDNGVIVRSPGLPITPHMQNVYSGNSGITTHFILPILGLRENAHQPIYLDCGEQMRARPIRSLVNALGLLGVEIQYVKEDGMLPVAISGKLKGGKAEIDGITSQYLSALLMALPCALNDSEITVKNLQERSYVDMTLEWLKKQKTIYRHEQTGDIDTYYIQGKQIYKNFRATISGDFSSASYLIAAAVMLEGIVILEGLDMDDPQGDKSIVTILQAMGANIIISPSSLTIHGGKPLKGIKIDANDIPDLLPTLAVVGTLAEGKTEIYHVKHARIKETDRIHSMTEGLRRLGAHIEDFEDSMIVHKSSLQGAQVKGYDDHRTVMALSVAGMIANGTTIVEGSEAINKTFPAFVATLQKLGAKINEIS